MCLISTVVYAQVPDVDKLASGGVNYALAAGLVLAIAALTWLGKRLTESFDARMAEAKAHAEALAEVRTQGAMLSMKMADALQVLDDTVRHLTKE